MLPAIPGITESQGEFFEAENPENPLKEISVMQVAIFIYLFIYLYVH